MRIAVRLFLAVVLLGLATGMAWAGGLYYWHFKVERIIRYMEEGGPGCTMQPEMAATLDRAGCRALPYLVRASKPDRPPGFLNFSTGRAVEILNRDPVLDKIDCDLRAKRREEMRVEVDDGDKVKTAKAARLQEWWARYGTETHQWWRFWTGMCRPAPE